MMLLIRTAKLSAMVGSNDLWIIECVLVSHRHNLLINSGLQVYCRGLKKSKY